MNSFLQALQKTVSQRFSDASGKSAPYLAFIDTKWRWCIASFFLNFHQNHDDAFDDVILYEDPCQRGRADGEVLGLLRESLAKAKRTQSVKEIHGEFLAIDTALENLQAGDLCLILVDQVDEALAHIAARGSRHKLTEALKVKQKPA